MPKLLRLTSEPQTFKRLLSGQPKFLKEQGWEVLLVSAGGREVDQVCRVEGVQHTAVPFVDGGNLVDDFVCFLELVQLFKKEKPDMVHSHGPKAGFLGMLAAQFVGVPIRIHSVSEMPTHVNSPEKGLTFQEKRTFSGATSLWVNSKGMLSALSQVKGMEGKPLTLLCKGSTNGVDLEKFNRNALKENHLVAATMRIMPGENDFILLAVGNLGKKKGVEELVKAFLSSKIVSKSKLVLVGAFDQENDPISLDTVQHIREHARIVHIDWTDHVSHHLALSDVLVHASHQEGFSNVLLEAAAMQVPIVCSDCPGNTSFISQKKTGLVFPVGNALVLKEAMEFAYVKRDYMATLAEELFKELVASYDRKDLIPLQVQEYQNLLQGKSNSR